MKKLRNMGMMALLVVAMIGCLSGCTPSSAQSGDGKDAKDTAKAGAADLESIYIYGEAVPNDMDDEDYDLYQLKLFTDGRYELVKTEGAHGYEMLLGITTIMTTGTYENGEAVDGLIPCKLTADRIIYNSYSDLGGYNITIDTEDAVYPVEMPGNKMTEEKDFKAMYGDATIYLIEDTNAFSLTNEW